MKAYLGLGSNLGDREANLRAAVRMLGERAGRVAALSAFRATEPWGYASDNPFLNAACLVETALPPLRLLRETQAIERALGRTEKSAPGRYADRLIDIDLLLCDDLVVRTPALRLPHPLMTGRLFVMEPLAEIAPDAVHPVLRKTMAEILRQLAAGG